MRHLQPAFLDQTIAKIRVKEWREPHRLAGLYE